MEGNQTQAKTTNNVGHITSNRILSYSADMAEAISPNSLARDFMRRCAKSSPLMLLRVLNFFRSYVANKRSWDFGTMHIEL